MAGRRQGQVDFKLRHDPLGVSVVPIARGLQLDPDGPIRLRAGSNRAIERNIAQIAFGMRSKRGVPRDEALQKKHGAIMAIDFPNMSRSFDATRRAVRFWGYDRVMESSFFVTEDALRDLQPNVNVNEAGLLNVFDSHRALICEIASKVYARGRKGSYVLVTADFKYA